MSASVLRRWFAVHKWTSLISTLFLLVICLTGLPLVFQDEIGDWLDDSAPYAQVAADAPRVSLDRVLAVARQHYPGQVATSVFVDDDEPQILVGMAPSWDRYNSDPATGHVLKFDAHTGVILRDDAAPAGRAVGFLPLMLHLHKDLFAGLAGTLFLGLMGLFFVLAIVSGVVLYGPFMKRLRFGAVRTGRAARLRWLDLHNLLGIVLTVWMGVVGLTGAMNELSQPLFAMWQVSTARTLLLPWQGRPVPAVQDLTSLDAVFQAVQETVPGMRVMSAVFPGSRFGSPYHYLVWTKGKTPLTGRLFTPVLVDARTGGVTAAVPMPWYLRALEISRPLHFGDYGGTPMKILWVCLDLGTIGVLVTGLVLWFGRRRVAADTRLRTLGFDLDETLPSVREAPAPVAAPT